MENLEHKLILLRKSFEERYRRKRQQIEEKNAKADQEVKDEVAEWIKQREAEEQAKDSGSKRQSRVKKRKWEAPEVVSAEAAEKIQQMMDEGFSEEESHWHHGTHSYPRDWRQSSMSDVEPEMHSQKFFDTHREMIGNWLQNARDLQAATADQDVNPVLYSSGKIRQTYKDYNKDYHTALREHKDSVKDLPVHERNQSIQEWKKDYHDNNPQHREDMKDLAKMHGLYRKSKEMAEQSFQDKIDYISGGGMSGGGDTHSTSEGGQHLGVDSKEMAEGTAPVQISKDPLAALSSNKKLMEALGQDKADRLRRIEAQRKAQQASAQQQAPAPEQPKTEAPEEAKPKTIIRRRPRG